MHDKINIGIVGNPNCGKTTLFNSLTGGKQRVGNWPGVTVERKTGHYIFNSKKVNVIDLPGIYSLSTSSKDEDVARNYILYDKPDLIVNIVDASNLERNLYLTIQLIEMQVPMIVVLNMIDVVERQKIKLNLDFLSNVLAVPIVCTIANKQHGTEDLKGLIEKAVLDQPISSADIYFPQEVESSINNIIDEFKKTDLPVVVNYRWSAIKLLENDIYFKGIFKYKRLLEKIDKNKAKIISILGEDIDIIIAESRYGFINSVCKKVVDKRNLLRKGVSDAIDRVVLNRIFGVPIFIAAMYLVFWITINFGGCFIDFFDMFCEAIFVDAFGEFLMKMRVPSFLYTFLAQGLGGGIQTISTFIPPIFFIFFCLTILEDSGYMSRAAFVMDGLMRMIGLPGKAFVPMLVGFGCNVPAIMSARTLENEKDRITVVLINSFMSCGARLPVYAVFTAAFFPNTGGLVVFTLYLIGIILAVLSALLFKKTILKGVNSSFIMELPPYHIPTVRGIFIHTWERLKAFMFKAGKAILLVVVVLTFLGSIGSDGSFGNKDSENSILCSIGKTIVPVFEPMGIESDNWPAAVGIFTGIFAKESVVGTLDSLYSKIDSDKIDDSGSIYDVTIKIKEAFLSIYYNLSKLEVPFSIVKLVGADLDSVSLNLNSNSNLKDSLLKYFKGKKGAFAYLLLVLLYIPCVASIAAIYRELNLKWMIFSCCYFSIVAWCSATVFYQIANFVINPVASIFWVSFCFIAFILVFSFLKRNLVRPDIGEQ